MAKLIVEEQKEYPTLPADSMLHVKVENVEIRTVNGQRGSWDKLEFKFKVLQVLSTGPNGPHVSNFDNLIGEYVYGSCSTKMTDSQENKTRLWAEAILGRPLELGFELDTDYFLQRECRAVTSTYEKRNINPATGKPFIGHQVQSLLPMGGTVTPTGVPGGVAAAPQAPQQSAPAGWGAPGVAAPAQDPWASTPQQPAANDPWAAQPQQPAQPVGQPAGAVGDLEPGF